MEAVKFKKKNKDISDSLLPYLGEWRGSSIRHSSLSSGQELNIWLMPSSSVNSANVEGLRTAVGRLKILGSGKKQEEAYVTAENNQCS